jgi:predicted P-loop ATPase
MFRRGYSARSIVATVFDRTNKISEHIYDQSNPRRYAEKQVRDAKKQITFSRDEDGKPHKTQANIRIALLKLGVTLRYDQFADRTLIDGLQDFGPVLDDAACDRIWLLFDQQFKLHVSKDLTRTVILDTALLNRFHPIRDYLNDQVWDGVERIDTWLTTYGGVENNEYSRAVGALFLTAAVRRVRNPGCKFDEMVVLEQEVQGTDKSSALLKLAVRDEWFSDDLPLNVEGKQVIEALRGRWIVEAGEMSGMRRTDIAHIKALLSRQVDRARLAYGRIVSEVPRQCVIVGTTNDLEYLRDATGNRRFWPVRCKRFDVAKLKQDRDQLWAEAAAREASGVSIRLASELWPKAGEEQAKRLTKDPWFEALQEAGLDDMNGKISMRSVWTILDVRGGQQTQEQSKRVGQAMRDLGWRRPNESGYVKIDGEPVSGYVKGEKPWHTVVATRDKDGNLYVD